MKRLILALAPGGSPGAEAGATAVEERRPYPKSSSDLQLL
jgi:hypothetical protein